MVCATTHRVCQNLRSDLNLVWVRKVKDRTSLDQWQFGSGLSIRSWRLPSTDTCLCTRPIARAQQMGNEQAGLTMTFIDATGGGSYGSVVVARESKTFGAQFINN